MKKFLSALAMLMLPVSLMASEADLKMPEGFADNAHVLYWGFLIVVLGLLFGLWRWHDFHSRRRVRQMPRRNVYNRS